jgi:hypothetical protein
MREMDERCLPIFAWLWMLGEDTKQRSVTHFPVLVIEDPP